MGVLQYKALVIVGEEPKVQKMWQHAQEFSERCVNDGELPMPLTRVRQIGNGLYTFAVLPTGSKVGWPYHQHANELMADLEAMAKVQRAKQWATTARVEWGEIESALFVDGRSAL